MKPENIAERLQAKVDSLTRAERQLADTMMENYPVSGLGSITTLAEKANDQPTADMVTARMQIHEKYAWMLRSMLGQ